MKSGQDNLLRIFIIDYIMVVQNLNNISFIINFFGFKTFLVKSKECTHPYFIHKTVKYFLHKVLSKNKRNR